MAYLAYVSIVVSALCSALAGAFLKMGAHGKTVNSFSDLLMTYWPHLAAVSVYGIGFILYAYSLKYLALTTAYPMMIAVATLFVVSIGTIFFQETLSPAKILGLILIIAGVVIVNR